MGAYNFRGCDHFLLGCIELAVADVFQNRTGEDEGILQHDAHLAAQGAEGDIADVVTIDFDAAFIDVVEPAQQIDDGRFARTCWTD